MAKIHWPGALAFTVAVAGAIVSGVFLGPEHALSVALGGLALGLVTQIGALKVGK